MRIYYSLIIAVYFCTSCTFHDNDCYIKPFNKQELLQVRDSLGIKSGRKYRKYDMVNLKPMDFIKYLSSVKAFEELNELEIKGYLGETLYIPYRLPVTMQKGWVSREDQIELMKLIYSKEPAIPVTSDNAASFPEELSTVGIEALHLIYYSEGNECAYLSNKNFCPLSKQDSMANVYKLKYSNIERE